MNYDRFDAQLRVTTTADGSSPSLDILQAGGMDCVALWVHDTAAAGCSVALQQSSDGVTWTSYLIVALEAGDTDGFTCRMPRQGNPQYVRLSEALSLDAEPVALAGVTLSIGI